MRSRLEKALVWYARSLPSHKGKFRLVEALWPLVCHPSDRFRIATTRFGGYEIPCDLNAFIQRQIYFFGDYFLERDLLAIWADCARSASIILDVGANIGIYSVTAAAANPRAQVHTFEPTPEIATALRDVVQRNALGGVRVHENAVMNFDGIANLVRCRGELGSNDGMNYVVRGNQADTSQIHTVRLDSFCSEIGIDFIDLMKLDVQGHEATALKGAGELIGNRIGVIFLELNWCDSLQHIDAAVDCIGLLSAAGYQFATTATWPNFRDAGDWLRDESDVIACSPAGTNRAGSSG